MFVNTAIEPAPPIRGRILCVRHIGASIEAPSSAFLSTYFSPVAEEGPYGIWTISISGMVLLLQNI
jgi:hypothetical protein